MKKNQRTDTNSNDSSLRVSIHWFIHSYMPWLNDLRMVLQLLLTAFKYSFVSSLESGKGHGSNPALLFSILQPECSMQLK